MGTSDNLQPAYPLNTHKQDWYFYGGVGGRGGGGLEYLTPSSRYSFWLDFDPFDVRNNKLLSQNVGFQIYSDVNGDYPLNPYIILSQYNDMTDALIESNLPTQYGQATTIPYATIIYAPFSFIDNGIAGNPQVPPTSSTNSQIPTNVAASPTYGGDLDIDETFYYCVTSTNGSYVESLPSAVVSATTWDQNDSIAITFTPVSGYTYTVYRNTSNNFGSGSGAVEVGFPYVGSPGYYLNTVFTSEPVSNEFQNDQGFYTLEYGYQGNGYGFGNNVMLAQGFVPTQAHLTGIFWGALFHSNTNVASTFYQLNFELWSSSNQFIQHLGSLQPTYNANVEPAGLTTDTANCTAYCNNISTVVGTDGNTYWSELVQPSLKFVNPVNVTPGTTYYLVVRQATQSASAYYYLGMNTNSSTIRSPYYYYPFANAYSAADGSSTWSELVDAQSNPITFPFLTQGNIGRFATTFWWANEGTVYWPWNSSTPSAGTYKYIHLDYNQRI